MTLAREEKEFLERILGAHRADRVELAMHDFAKELEAAGVAFKQTPAPGHVFSFADLDAAEAMADFLQIAENAILSDGLSSEEKLTLIEHLSYELRDRIAADEDAEQPAAKYVRDLSGVPPASRLAATVRERAKSLKGVVGIGADAAAPFVNDLLSRHGSRPSHGVKESHGPAGPYLADLLSGRVARG